MLYNWRERIEKHDYVIDGVLAHPYESIQMGNGDLGASVNIYPHEIKITLAKSDVWDARFDGRPEEDVLKHDDLIRMVEEKDRDLRCTWSRDGDPNADFLADRLVGSLPPHVDGPAPKRVGCIRLYHPGLSNTKVSTRLNLAEGILETRFFFAEGELIVRALAEKDNNRFWLRAESKGQTPWFAVIVEKEPDQADASMPMPVLRKESEYVSTIEQTVPEGFDIEKFTWCMAAAFQGRRDGVDAGYIEHHAWRLRQYCALKPGNSAVFCIGIATDRDGETDTRSRALSLSSFGGNFDALLLSHKKSWEKFWETSNIMIEDSELESVWYRNHFAYGCALSRKSKPLGSGGNVMIQDFEPWHGDIHTNHNFQKWYCTALPTNHAEWIDVYADFIENTLPLFEYQAELIFGLKGAYCELSYLPIMSHKYFNVNNLMGRALAVTGWMGQPLWWHWEYIRDKEWLKNRAYPFLKKSAQFYYNYMEKYSDETGEIYPSIRLEEPGWKKDFIGNRNVISDLCMFKKAFDRAIAASEILEIDEEWREKWKTARSRVPAIEHGIDENGEGWIALDKHWAETEPKRRADEARYSRWGGGGWIVYPGEYVDGGGDDSLTLALRDMIRRTDLINPFCSQLTGENIYPGVPVIHPISSIVPAIRLQLKDKFDSIRQVLLSHRLTYGQFSSYMLSDGVMPKEVMGHSGYIWYDWRSVENKYIGVLAVTEMLLQSQGGVIRLFPFLPEAVDASFEGLRATGGFIVSAKRKNGKVSAVIKSTAGEKLQLKWEKGAPHVTCGNQDVTVLYENGVAYLQTTPGMSYECGNL